MQGFGKKGEVWKEHWSTLDSFGTHEQAILPPCTNFRAMNHPPAPMSLKGPEKGWKYC